MKWLKKRIQEPSTILGLAIILQGIGTATKDDHIPQIAAQIGQQADTIASGDWTTGAAIIMAGVLGILMKEKGE